MGEDDINDEVGSGGSPFLYPVFTGRSIFEFAATVVPVLQRKFGVTSGCGTAFFVSEVGLFVTAGHVINGEFPQDLEAGDYEGTPGEVFFILVPSGDGVRDSGHLVGVTVDQIVFEPRSCDVAILKVDMDKIPIETRRHMRPWPLTNFRPTVGENTVVAGYADMPIDVPINDDGNSEPGYWKQTLSFAEGPVLTLSPSGRDRVLAPFPSFDVAVLTSGGMSGGPVFVEEGLVGVISRGWTGIVHSTVALVVSCYHLGVDLDLGEGDRTYSMAELIRSKKILAFGPRVEIHTEEPNPDDQRLRVEWPDP